MGYAILSNEPNHTVFKYGGHTIRFRAPHSLEYYSSVKEWDHGYLVVMAKYSHNSQDEEEYIDLVPILEDLYFDAETFLKPIKEVRIGMDRQQLFDHVKHHYGTTPDYPWADQNAVQRHKENRKWYGVILKVGRDKLGLPGDGLVDVLNVKCDPFLIGSLRIQEGFHPAYHMNKEQWISIRLDGSVAEDTIESLLDLSFVATKGTAKKAAKIVEKK